MYLEIEQLFQATKPDILLNEGGEWPEIEDRDSTILKQRDPGFARFLARTNNVKYRSIEPPDSLVYEKMTDVYHQDSVLLMYLVRYIDQLKRIDNQKHLEDSVVQKILVEYLKNMKNRGFPIKSEKVNYEYIEDLYYSFFQDSLQWRSFNSDYYIPILNTCLLNEICRRSTQIRDEYMISEIEKELSKHNTIFIVMGGSHVIAQEPVIRYIWENK